MMDAPKVVIRRGDATDEYPLLLPIEPTYREMNFMETTLERPASHILFFAGVSPTYDVAVAIYAMARERGREFTQSDAEDLLDLTMGQIEVVYADEPEKEGEPADPEAVSGSVASESDSAAEPQTESESSTSAIPEDSGTP